MIPRWTATDTSRIVSTHSTLMKRLTFPIGIGVRCSLATTYLMAAGTVSAADEAAARSVKDLRLKVSPNGRHFVDQDGKPFFYLGDTCWLLFQRPNREELDEYLKDRVAKGFTVIQAYVLRGLDKNHPDGNSSLLDATPLIDRDPTRPNEAFFQHVDYVVNRANELGLVMGLVTAKSWHVNEHPEKVFDEKNAYDVWQIPGRALQEQCRDVVSGRRLASGKGRGGLGGDGQGPGGRQRRPPPRLLPRPGQHVVIDVVPQGGLARFQLDPVRP